MCSVMSDKPGQDDQEPAEQGPLDEPLSDGQLALLRAIDEAAARHWKALPDKPDMAVPVSQEGLNEVQAALDLACARLPRSPEVTERIRTFATVLDWAAQSRFCGTFASPVGAGLLAAILVALSLDPSRLPGAQSRLMLLAGSLSIQALLFPSIARQAQFAINARFLAGTLGSDERFVRWLVSKGALLYTPISLLRALLYGALIPLSLVRHLMRRAQFAAAAAVLVLNFMVVLLAANIPDGVPNTPDDFDVGVDVLGHWVPYEDPLRSLPEGATRLQDYGWTLRRDDKLGGVEASMYLKRGQLSTLAVKAWAPAKALDSNPHLSSYQRSADRLEATWGAPTQSRSEPNADGSCRTRWLTYARARMRLEVRELTCTSLEHRSSSRRISVSANRP